MIVEVHGLELHGRHGVNDDERRDGQSFIFDVTLEIAEPKEDTIEATVDYLRGTLGEEAWAKGMSPDVPETKILDNPYTYTEYHTGSTHGH